MAVAVLLLNQLLVITFHVWRLTWTLTR